MGQISLSIIAGITIYVFGQIISKFFIESIHEQKKVIAEINDALIFYANQFYLYEIKDPKADEVVDKIRSLSTRLRAKTYFIPFYKILSKIDFVCSKEKIDKACSALIGLSNSVYKNTSSVDFVEKYRKEISESLKIII
jgi:methenyltetrahydromethanopterin cyclohydrolase